MESVVPIQKDIVLIGGGHSHVAVLRGFGMKPIPGVRLTLISPTYETPYSGMLPGYLAGHYSLQESHINLAHLCQFAKVQFYCDTVTGLDLERKKIRCQQHPEVAFDLVSIDTGSTPTIADVPGAKAFALPVKPVDTFLDRWQSIEADLKSNNGCPQQITVVGGGAGGVELTLSLQHRLNHSITKNRPPHSKPSFTLVTSSPEILTSHNRRVRKSYASILNSRGISVLPNFRVVEVSKEKVISEDGAEHSYDHLLWLTHASAPSWPKNAGLDVDDRGFILVNDFLQSTSHPFVFAAGDVASMLNHTRPKSGVYAVRQGPPLTENLRRTLYSQPLKAYTPQKRFLSLISTGDQYAIASKGQQMLKGNWVWRWKDQIDRRFMKRYQQLPEMSSNSPRAPKIPPLPDDSVSYQKIRCTGCGSKVGSHVLSSVLSRLKIESDVSISIGLESPDDAAVFRLPSESPLIQTVDYFPAFLDDPWLFAQIATTHCLSDIIAMGGSPHSAQILVTVPYGHPRQQEETLFQTMTGALKILQSHGATLLGGHTLEGERLAFGMTVNGTIQHSTLFRKEGLKVGDHLVITKPIGTGILLAAQMRRMGLSDWLENAVNEMKRSNSSAIPILRNHRVVSATDLTGFGLIGHLKEMLDASQVGAEISLSSIPLLPGALECSAEGVTSSLYQQNEQASDAISNRETFRSNNLYPAVFDPQTSGGLLFGVSGSHLEECLSELKLASWQQSTRIGLVTRRVDAQTSIKFVE